MPRGPPAAQPGGHGADDTGPGGQRGPGADRPAHRLLRPARQRRADHRRGRLGERAGHRVHACPGIYTERQEAAWSRVTGVVHAMGGRIVAQLWHAGSNSHPDHLGGALPAGPSAVNPQEISRTPAGRRETLTPRAMTSADIDAAIADYASASALRPARRIRRRGDRRQRYVPDRPVPQPAAEPPQRRVRRARRPAAARGRRRGGRRLGGAAGRRAAVTVLDGRGPSPAARAAAIPVHGRRGDPGRLRRARGRAQRTARGLPPSARPRPGRAGRRPRLRGDRPVPHAVRRPADRQPWLRPGYRQRDRRGGNRRGRVVRAGCLSPTPTSSAGSPWVTSWPPATGAPTTGAGPAATSTTRSGPGSLRRDGGRSACSTVRGCRTGTAWP